MDAEFGQILRVHIDIGLGNEGLSLVVPVDVAERPEEQHGDVGVARGGVGRMPVLRRVDDVPRAEAVEQRVAGCGKILGCHHHVPGLPELGVRERGIGIDAVGFGAGR